MFTVEELRHAHRIVGAAEAPICLAAVTIIVPQGNSMRALGAELVEHGVDFQAAREEAERRAKAGGLEMAPSFHRDLVRGAATYALELFNAVPDLAPLYVSIGRSLDFDDVAKPIQGRVQVAYSTAHRLAEAQFSFTLPFTGSLPQRI